MASTDRASLDALREATTRSELALARAERAAEAQARKLARRLEDLDAEQRQTARALDDEYRREHFGRPPP
jgi:hypothetical protein